MRELVIISGKGGTGKTSITASFAFLSENLILCDADVDAADLHLLSAPRVLEKSHFFGGHLAVLSEERCTLCGICQSLCRFEAITPPFSVNPVNCEGCGVCVNFCPDKAIELQQRKCGQWFISHTRFGPMVHARLGIAEENSGKLVALVREQAKKLMTKSGRELLITDGPPGIGCPVIASLGGATMALVVTEPSVSGIHDMERVVQLAHGFKVPLAVCINKSDLNPAMSQQIQHYCQKRKIKVVGEIPYDPAFSKAMINGQTIMEFAPESEAGKAVKKSWDSLIRTPEMNQVAELQFQSS